VGVGEHGVTSERRVVAVLFADMAGFTALTEKIDPEVVTDVMNEVFAALGAEVEAVGGHVDKVVGDELMALFGAPVAHEDDALRAVRAAVGMQRAMQARQEMLHRAFGQAPRLRIGIHSGQVVWGVVGPPGQARPTVMGDVVNLASRLQHAATEGGILVSEAVARQIRGTYLSKAWEPIVVKGKAEPIAVYEVIGERERAEPMYRPPFVDREQDLEQLRDLLARGRGRAQVVVLSGDPGVGKTRLVEEFTRGLPEDVLFLQTACPPYGGESLGPLADLFRQLVGLAGPTTVAEVEARIPLGERAARAAMVVSRLFNLAEVPPGDEVTHETALLVAAETVRRLITRPTVVWIEDLQWADAGTRELLPFMMERLTDAPLLLVGNLRAGEEPPPWGKRTAVTTMQLEPLGEEDARVLLAAMLEERLPADVERALIGKAGGNPFYLSEIVATLRSMGVLIRDDRGRWRTTGPVDKVLPDTVQGALLARLDRLAPDQRTLVQRAAVVGVSFSQSLLGAVSPDIDVLRVLHQLEEADLLRRRDPFALDPEYVFVHPLLREVAYASLLHKHQAALHWQVAEALERQHPERPDELAKTIGTHLDRAGDPARALPYLLQAGRRAAQQYATREAVELLERTRVLARELGRSEILVEACELLGDLYPRMQERGWTDEFDVWQAVLNHLDPSADPARAARAAIRAASARIKESRIDEARPLLAQAESWLTGDHPLWSHLLSERAQLLIRESQYREALRIAREAVEVADRRGTLVDRSHALSTLAHPAILPLMGEEGRRLMRSWVAEVATKGEERLLTDARHIVASDIWTRGMVDEELFRFIEDGVARAAEFGWTRDEIGLRMMLGWGYFLTGRWAEASALLERAHGLLETLGGYTQGYFHILLPYFRGNAAMGRGALEEGKRIFEQALERPPFHAPIWLNHDLGRCLLMLGEQTAARAAMARALAARDRFRCIICGCQANGIAAEFYATLEDPAAEPLLEEAEATAAEIGHVATRIRARRARARLALQRGRANEAVEAARQALALGEALALHQPFEQGQTLLLFGEAHQAGGNRTQAVESWRRAREIFSHLGAAWHLRQTEEALGRAGVTHA